MQLKKLKRRLKVALRDAYLATGLDLYRRSRDRRVLHGTILPYFAKSAEFKRVVFVGCDWYTRGYQRLFAHCDYWTVDYDPAKQRFGATQHIVDSMTNLAAHFSPGSVDLILCNGVFGYGLNEATPVATAFQGCYECLRDGGVLVLGWNDIAERRPFDPLTSPGLTLLQPFVFPPLKTARYLVPMRTRHVYDFLIK